MVDVRIRRVKPIGEHQYSQGLTPEAKQVDTIISVVAMPVKDSRFAQRADAPPKSDGQEGADDKDAENEWQGFLLPASFGGAD